MAAHPPPPPRTRSARLTLVSLLLIPLLSLAALWGFTASITLGNVIRDQNYNKVVDAIAPSITVLGQMLQAESAVTLVWLGSGREPGRVRAQLLAARGATDKLVPAAGHAVGSVRGVLAAPQRTALDAFVADLAGLGRLRAAVDSGADSQAAAFSAYNAISNAKYSYFDVSAPPNDPDLSLMAQSAIGQARAQDFTSGAVALVDGALAARGLMGQRERALFAETVGQQNLQIAEMFSAAGPALTALFKRIYDTPAYRRLLAMEGQIETSPASRPIPVGPAAFRATVQANQAAAMATGRQIGAVVSGRSAQLTGRLLAQLYLAAGLGLAAVAASVFVMARFGRRLQVGLTDLYDSARQMANERLPRIVERLRRGEDVDVEAESPPLKAGRITEIANVAQAFSTVQRTAVEAAVGQASLRKGVNRVFVNLSLRNQSLLHRQLGMLDTMERATSDPAVLADLFRLDHVTTRMRRHAEGLLILAGSTPGRGWRTPVPVVDVLQAAIAEVEDYVRVDVTTDSADAVAGIAVNDVIHLIAELVENATAFSPPSTRVEISGDSVAHGFAVEIMDRGLGMPPEAMAAINESLASPSEFDLASSEQLGLFVAGQLAARHGIKVALRRSPYGGTTAVVVLPRMIMASEPETAWWPDPDGSGDRPAAAADGPAREAWPTGPREHHPAFGMTGRHRLRPASSGAGSGGAATTGPVEEPELPLGGTVSWFPPGAPPAPDRPGRSEPGPAPVPPGSPVATVAAWTTDPAEPTGTTASTGPATGSQTDPGQAISGTAADSTYRGLPRRPRQASLAPQLRREPGPGSPAHLPGPLHPGEAAGPAARSPEETSSLMSALQAGWLRGRLDDLDDAGLGILDERPGGASGEAEPNDREVES